MATGSTLIKAARRQEQTQPVGRIRSVFFNETAQIHRGERKRKKDEDQ